MGLTYDLYEVMYGMGSISLVIERLVVERFKYRILLLCSLDLAAETDLCM